ncbi:Fe-S cluster assembly protein SufD [Parvularcula flava]|uniref:Fe-S cluster assembly protein SufD n=1 Tax=Aquisalinus luteolus TaxID=1566827 RepID=A0A8J3A6D9_9PROT|nr:Fe-S cluster assembly protein SufD [Aquisalinus luteolus]NHK27783.1 Fe-S cluster assembly protein SufD [Aquisalinus luteolus]GGH96486.1 Fe-S cluster assembly protein SufD [Aquisalinus luteolus]
MRPNHQFTEFEKALIASMPAEGSEVGTILSDTGLPSRRDERWKWTDVRAALREEKQPSVQSVSSRAPLLALDQPIEFLFANGHLSQAPASLPDGVTLSRGGGYPLFRENLPNIATEKAEATYVLTVSGKLDRPIHLRFLSEGSGMHHTSVQVVLEEGAEASVVESLEGGEDAWFANGVMRFTLAKGASLERLILQQANDDAVQVHFAMANLAAEANFTQGTLGFGSKLCRLETQVLHEGEGARAVLNGAYLLSGRRHLDNTTDVGHTVPGCVTEELYKGVLADKGRGVFQGRFYVAKDAQQTDARMAHNALLLSDEAEVDAKPELMIYADDVQCAHGNTAGALDTEALFYMRQRGLTEAQARAMLVQAFVAEAFEHISDDDVKARLTALIETWLDQQTDGGTR